MENFSEYFEVNLTAQEHSEGEGKPRSFKANGKLLTTNVPTLNRRMYPKELMAKAIEAYSTGYIKQNSSFMLNGHPEEAAPKPTDAIGAIKSLDLEGDDVIGDMTVFDTSAGRDLQTIIRSGHKIGISLRGRGTLVPMEDKSDIMIPSEDFVLLGFDFVLNPASVGAGIDSFKIESKEGGKTTMTLDDLKKQHPELFKQFEDEVAARVKKETEDAMTAEFERMKEEIAKELAEKLGGDEDLDTPVEATVEEDGSVRCPNCNQALTIPESVAGECPAKLKTAEDALSKATEDLSKATEQISTLTKENAELKVREHISQALKDNPHRELIESKIGTPATVEEADEKIKAEVAFIESVVSTTKTNRGITNIEGVKLTDPEIKEQLRLSGIY